MTSIGWDFVPSDGQELGLQKGLGAALAEMVRRCWPHHTAKQASRTWGLDATTAANVVKGHASERTLTKIVHSQQQARQDAWELWDAIGAELIGETREAYEERKLRQIIDEANRAQQGIQRLRARRERLEAVASDLVDVGAGLAPASRRRAGG